MISDLDTATSIARRVTAKCKEFGIPMAVQNHFVIMVSIVMDEIREETRRKKKEAIGE